MRAVPGAAALAALVLALLLSAGLAADAPAQATPGQGETLPGGLVRPDEKVNPPAGRFRSHDEVVRIADRLESVRRERAAVPGGGTREAFLKGPTQWQVSYYDERGRTRREIAQVLVDDRTGAVLEQWTDYKVAWTMTRGYDGAFGRKVNSPWIWVTLCLLFVAPFVDPRRPLRWLHLDLLVLSGFSVALACFNNSVIDVSTPLVYPLLGYLLVRMLVVGLRRGPADEQARRPLRLLVPVPWLAVGLVFLVGFRIGLNLTDSNVIDVGYAGVIGADKLADGEPLYGGWPADNEHGDTYGPVLYAAYVPFEQLLPWSGRWDDLHAAHGAALVFDLLALACAFLVGRRIRGPALGIVLAYAWAAFPFTLFVSNTNANDALIAALVLAAVAAAARPAARGALLALAGLAKFAPLALVPLFATQPDRSGRLRVRTVVLYALAFAAVGAVALIPVFLHGGGLQTFYERTLGYQTERDAPLSIWGLWGGLEGLQFAVQAGAVLLALALAVVPRRRDGAGLAALCAAVIIALQLGAEYWFFLYLVWFVPLVLVALLGRYAEPAR